MSAVKNLMILGNTIIHQYFIQRPIVYETRFALIQDSFTPSDMNFQTVLMPKVIFAKILSQKIYSLGPFLCEMCFSKTSNAHV